MPITVRQRTIQTKNASKKNGKTNKKSTGFWFHSNKKIVDREMLVTNALTDLRGVFFPSTKVAFVALLLSRLCAAFWSHITDCDETYNYWEPLHYLLYGDGLQTWEYSPEFAIRSYAALWIFVLPAKGVMFLVNLSPVTIFYLLRCVLALITASSELLLYKGICAEFGVHVGRVWLALSLVSCGGFVSASAMLPSAWCGALASVAMACCWLKKLPIAVFFTAFSALYGWPFAGLLGVPIALDLLFRRGKLYYFMKWCALCLAVLAPPLLVVDSWYYGRLVFAPWNIVHYNIFTSHGPDLYGVEAWTFYIVNGFLNYNIVWILALVAPLLLMLCDLLIPHAKPRAAFCQPYWLSLMPLYLWLAVFILQPHKEERFLFPVYPMICLCGAVCVDCIQKLAYTAGHYLSRLWGGRPDGTTKRKAHYLTHTTFIMLIVSTVAALLGMSRIAALYNNYHAPMEIFAGLPQHSDEVSYSSVNVCFAKDWYRSTPSFLLPDRAYRIKFVKSEFSGLLPAPYADGTDATRIIHDHFNNANKEDTRLYTPIHECHYLVDSDMGTPTSLQPDYSADTHTWEIIKSLPFLDTDKSHSFFRAFYIPFVSQSYTTFGHLNLLRNKSIKK